MKVVALVTFLVGSLVLVVVTRNTGPEVCRRLMSHVKDRAHRMVLRRMLIALVTALNEHGVEYWVDFGTLLGLHREGDVILGDNDIDVCIRDDLRTHELMQGPVKKHLEEHGYELTKETWSAYRVWIYGVFADVYITSEENGIVHGATGENSDISTDLIGNPKKLYWKKGRVSVFVPEHVEDVLLWRYGDDWYKPRPNFKGRDS